MLTGPEHGSRGMTMIEVVVAMILLGLVVGGVVYAVTQLGSGSNSLAANRNAQRDALDAMEQMRHDVAAARSPALEQFEDRRESLRDLMYFADDSKSPSPGDRSRNLCDGARGDAYVACLRSVTWASGNAVWFRADVDNTDNAVANCVGYEVRNGALRRYLSDNWRGCGPGVRATAQQTELLSAQSLATSRGGRIFTYTLRYQPRMRQNVIPDPQGCRTFRATDVPASQLAFVSTVDVDLSGIAVRRDQAALAGLTTSAAVSAHLAGDYAFATGCAP